MDYDGYDLQRRLDDLPNPSQETFAFIVSKRVRHAWRHPYLPKLVMFIQLILELYLAEWISFRIELY